MISSYEDDGISSETLMMLYFFNRLNREKKIKVIMFHQKIKEMRCHQSMEMKNAKSKDRKPQTKQNNLLIYNILNNRERKHY